MKTMNNAEKHPLDYGVTLTSYGFVESQVSRFQFYHPNGLKVRAWRCPYNKEFIGIVFFVNKNNNEVRIGEFIITDLLRLDNGILLMMDTYELLIENNFLARKELIYGNGSQVRPKGVFFKHQGSKNR
jgi:hypothetical protein